MSERGQRESLTHHYVFAEAHFSHMLVHFIVFPQEAHLVSHFMAWPQPPHLLSWQSAHFTSLWQVPHFMFMSPQRTSLPQPVHLAAMSAHVTEVWHFEHVLAVVLHMPQLPAFSQPGRTRAMAKTATREIINRRIYCSLVIQGVRCKDPLLAEPDVQIHRLNGHGRWNDSYSASVERPVNRWKLLPGRGLWQGCVNNHLIADADCAALDYPPVNAAATVGGEGLAQALMEAVHQLARSGFTGDLQDDRPDSDGFADQIGQRIGIDQYVGPARMPGKLGGQFFIDLAPLVRGQEGDAPTP
jgi:hypothetical protein